MGSGSRAHYRASLGALEGGTIVGQDPGPAQPGGKAVRTYFVLIREPKKRSGFTVRKGVIAATCRPEAEEQVRAQFRIDPCGTIEITEVEPLTFLVIAS